MLGNENINNNTESKYNEKLTVIKSFACLDDKQGCDKQCVACKFIEYGLKKQLKIK